MIILKPVVLSGVSCHCTVMTSSCLSRASLCTATFFLLAVFYFCFCSSRVLRFYSAFTGLKVREVELHTADW